MMEYTSKRAARLLGISLQTLREWSDQFGTLLSESANCTPAGPGDKPGEPHYTPTDLDTLRKAKALLDNGHSAEEVLRELDYERLQDQFAKPPRPIVWSIPKSRLPESDREMFDLPAMSADESEAIAELKRKLHSQQRQIEQLRQYLLRLQAENDALHEQFKPWSERHPTLFSFRSRLILTLCLVAVLAALGIALLLGQQGARDVEPAAGILAVATSQESAGSTDMARRTASSLPPPITATSREPVQTSAQAAATMRQPSTAAATQDLASENRPAGAIGTSPTVLSTPTNLARALAPTTSPQITSPTAQTSKSPTVSAVVQQVARAEAMLHSGEIMATIDYGNGAVSTAQVRFDLGDEQRVARFQIISTYKGTSAVQTVERITIADQEWNRKPDGTWVASPAAESVVKQLQGFLSRIDTITTAEVERDWNTNMLRWYDASHDADTTLMIDPVSGIPKQLRRVARAGGTVFTVSYRGWNTPVQIVPPKLP